MLNKLEKRLKKMGDLIQIDDLIDVAKLTGNFNRIVTREHGEEIRMTWHTDLPKNKTFLEYEEIHFWSRGSQSGSLTHNVSTQEFSIGEKCVPLVPRLTVLSVSDEIMELVELFLRHKDKFVEAQDLLFSAEGILKGLYKEAKERKEEYYKITTRYSCGNRR